MYRALAALNVDRKADRKPAQAGTSTGSEVAEIAVCLAIGENDPVILACPALGARSVRKGCKVVRGKDASGKGDGKGDKTGGRLAAATLSAVAALLGDPKATVVVCAGKLDPLEDYRGAFRFAARHRLPILFLVANHLTPGRRQELELRTLYEEFGIPVFSVDANDAIAAYRVTTEALHNARQLRGPCVIEALTVAGKGNGSASPLELLQGYMERHENWPL
jgi:hypothetical protein